MTIRAMITRDTTFSDLLIPANASKDDAHRLAKYIQWLTDSGRGWLEPDLAQYRDYLLNAYSGRDGQPLSAVSVQAHLATIRGQYRKLLRRNGMALHLEAVAYDWCIREGHEPNPANVEAMVRRAKERLENAIDPDNAPVAVTTRQDRADEDQGLRLTKDQAESLLNKPGVDSLQGLRDTAMIALMLCTGAREAELCALDVVDLRVHLGGDLALHIRKGKGSKERLIPYGALDWCLPVIATWLKAVGIESGAVFRGFYKGGQHVRATRITVRAINQILDRYSLSIGGQTTLVQPHDLRRTYAARLYEAGMDILAIQQNLGHADHKTTEKYIGKLDASARKPRMLYHFDLSKLSASG